MNDIDYKLPRLRWFTFSEFFPNCSGSELFSCLSDNDRFCNVIRLLLFLDEVRRRFGYPIRITSGYRDVLHNLRAGGVSTSQHLYCEACDITATNGNIVGLLEVIKTLQTELSDYCGLLGQVIYYPKQHFIHIGLAVSLGNNKIYPYIVSRHE